MQGTVYGLDFGTTNSAIAVLNENEKVKNLSIGCHGGSQMRSVMFFSAQEQKFYFGDSAINKYVSADMKGRFIQSVKRILPYDWFTGTTIGYKRYKAEDLVALVLSEIKTRADKLSGHDINSVVLGRPARFSDNDKKEAMAQERLLLAAEKAGFKEVHLQLEPIAAAFSYEARLSNPELVLVADLGGGTSDFALITLDPKKIGNKNRGSDVIATSGVSVGGDDLDSAIMRHKLIKYFGANITWESGGLRLPMPNHIMTTLQDWYKISSLFRDIHIYELINKLLLWADDTDAIKRLKALIEENLGFSLYRAIERAKCELSNKEQTCIRFNESIIKINELISRKEFNEMILNHINKLDNVLCELLNQAGIQFSDIDSVFLTGGTSYIPKIIDLFVNKFGSKKIKFGNRFSSVVEGLARSQLLFNE